MRTVQLTAILILFVASSYVAASSFAYKYRSPDGSIILSDQELGSPFTLVELRQPSYVELAGEGPVAGPMSESIAKRKNKFSTIVETAAKKLKMDKQLLHAIIEAESAYQPTVVSHAGAIGLMQLMPGTAARYGVLDPRNPQQNVKGGTQYLKFLLGYYENDLKLAIAAYNAGEGAVAADRQPSRSRSADLRGRGHPHLRCRCRRSAPRPAALLRRPSARARRRHLP